MQINGQLFSDFLYFVTIPFCCGCCGSGERIRFHEKKLSEEVFDTVATLILKQFCKLQSLPIDWIKCIEQ